jgi:hypothetical protein
MSARFLAAAAAAGQLAVPLRPPPASIDAGVQHVLRSAFLRSARMLAGLAPEGEQAPIILTFRPMFRSRASQRPCKYPFEMVNDARLMRQNGYEYKEIAQALSQLYRKQLRLIGVDIIPWITVRDWTQHYYRVLK